MPKLWEGTIRAHRDAVRDAIVETTWQLAREHGLRSVTMSRIASSVGIGRATLYKYFPDVEAILLTGHQQHVTRHLEHLEQVGSEPGTPVERLGAVLMEFARICQERGHRGTEELGALVHKPESTRDVEERVHALITGLVRAAAETGDVRRDVAPAELARFCAHALAAAGVSPDPTATRRLVDVCLRGLSPV